MPKSIEELGASGLAPRSMDEGSTSSLHCTPPAPFPHPETGELLETKDEFIDAMNNIELRMSPMWIVRRQIREEYARRFDPYLPTRRNRSDKQERVARCPRCGGKEVVE